ncbi:hypothetical protein [Streptomyces sp. NPDC004100]
MTLTAASGCTVSQDVVAGISVTADGHLLGVMSVYGWTKDNTLSASNVSFTPADRDRLTPGKVRYDSVADNGDESAITVSTAEFKANACRNT